MAALERLPRLFRRTPAGLSKESSPVPVPTFGFEDPMVYPHGRLTLSTYSHQFVLGQREQVPVSLIPGTISLNQTLYIHHTNLRRAETDEVRQALPVRV